MYELKFDFGTTATTIGAEVTNFIIDNINASNDFVDAIRITWTELNTPESGVSYEYRINDGSWTSFNPGTNKYYDFKKDAVSPVLTAGTDYTFKIRATTDNSSYTESPVSDPGRLFDISSVGITATKGEYNDRIEVTWDGRASEFVASDDIVYTLNIGDQEYSGDDFSYSYSSYEYSPSYSDSPDEYGKEIKFSISAYNKNQDGQPKTTTGETTEGDSTGYIVPVPEVTSASKGTHSDVIDISWTCNLSDKVSSYNINIYNEEGTLLHEVSSATNTTYNFNYNEIAGIEKNKFQDFRFEVTAVDSASNVESIAIPQGKYATEQNNFKENEAVNVGYFFDNTAFYDNVTFKEATDPVDKKYIADYLTVTFPANKTVETYILSGYSDPTNSNVINRTGDPLEFNIDDLNTKVEENGVTYWTNGGESTDLGYIAFNSKDHMITVNTSTGVLDDKNGFIVNNFSISGTGSSSSLITVTPDTPITCGMHRGFNKYDYLNAFNKIMYQALHEIDSEFRSKENFYRSGWVGYYLDAGFLGTSDQRVKYIIDTLEGVQEGSLGNDKSIDGYIKFKNYQNGFVVLASDNIDYETTSYGTQNSAGVKYIGQNGSYSIDMNILSSTYISGTSGLKFKDATIDLTILNINPGMPGCDLHITNVDNSIDEDLDIAAGSDQANNIYNMPY